MGVREIETWELVGAYPVCSGCGSRDVVRDAWAQWNLAMRDWELKTVFDEFNCDGCGIPGLPEWRVDKEFRLKRIRRLNDAARRGEGANVTVVVTVGVQALGEDGVRAALGAVASFDDFTEESDPHGEHDFGAVEIADQKLFWKIDYFDLRLTWHSPDKANEKITQRVLTIMLVSDY